MKLQKRLCIALAAALLFGLVSCAKKAKEPTEAQIAKRDELAQEFMGEIRDTILPHRRHPLLVASMGILVSEGEKVEDLTLLESFLDDYRSDRDCGLTVCFITSSFVVAKIHVIDGMGYLFRYEYDANTPIAVTSKFFDDIKVTEDEEIGKILLKLEYGGAELATYTFRPQSGDDLMPPEP